MLAPRRFLPPTHILASFETAARTGGFTRAAQELSLTQGAVSRHIRALEDQLGVLLFVRDRQRVRLTDAGASYAREVREALQIIAAASLALRANPAGGSLNLAILPTFGTRWLAPRLPQFLSAHSGVTINLTTRLRPFDFGTERQDAAIHFGAADWPGTHSVFLMDEQVIPVASPAFLADHPVSGPDDLRGLPLLHLATRGEAWESWFESHGSAAGKVAGMMFDQFAMMAHATVHGAGVALLPAFLVDAELQAGTLMPVLDAAIHSAGAYHLVWPSERGSYPPLVQFRDWIEAEAQAARAEDGEVYPA